MNESQQERKRKIIQWIERLDDENILKQLEDLLIKNGASLEDIFELVYDKEIKADRSIPIRSGENNT